MLGSIFALEFSSVVLDKNNHTEPVAIIRPSMMANIAAYIIIVFISLALRNFKNSIT